MNIIEIKTDLSVEELQVLMWDLEAFCEMKGLSQPVLLQADVSGKLAVDECKCIRYVGGSSKWYPNGCKIHPDG